MTGYAKELATIARDLLRNKRALANVPRELEQRERAIRENDDLIAETKKIELRKVRDDLRRTQQKLHKEKLDLVARGEALEKKIRVLRPVEETARSRVRELQERGLAASQILEHAVSLGDDEMVAALRAEMMWFGGKDGFEDTADAVRACDRALAQIGRGGEQDNNVAMTRVTEARHALDAVDEFAAKTVLGTATPTDRLSLAYAVGPEPAEED